MSSLKKESKMNRNISKINDAKENEAKTESKKKRIEKSLDDYF